MAFILEWKWRSCEWFLKGVLAMKLSNGGEEFIQESKISFIVNALPSWQTRKNPTGRLVYSQRFGINIFIICLLLTDFC
jgi:hypothetical protein